MFNKIQNPITGNWVNTDGTLGKKILHNYINQTGGSRKRPSPSSRARAASKRRSRRKVARRKQQAVPKLKMLRLPPRGSGGEELRAGYEPGCIADIFERPRSPDTPSSIRERYNETIQMPLITAQEMCERTNAALAARRAATAARNAGELSQARRRYQELLKHKSQKRRKSTRGRKH